jgi:hypothetical protein
VRSFVALPVGFGAGVWLGSERTLRRVRHRHHHRANDDHLGAGTRLLAAWPAAVPMQSEQPAGEHLLDRDLTARDASSLSTRWWSS